MRFVRWLGLCLVLGALGAIGLEWQATVRHAPAPAVVATAAQAAPAPPAPPPSLTLSFVGDIMLAGNVGRVAAAQGTQYLFAGVRQVLRADDLTVGNLECAVATVGTPEKKQYTFRAAPDVLPGLKLSGVDAVSLANNHALDYGRAALQQTFTHLQRTGIPFAGAGVNADAAARPVIITVKGQRVALLGASRVLPATTWHATARNAGIASAYDPTRLLQQVRAARPQAELVVVYLHWGKERETMPQAYQRTLGQQCIDAGADLVVGAHPHVLQGFEYYRGKLIAYSQGNFVFTNRTKATAILQTTFSGGTLQRATVVPCYINAYRPQLLTDTTARRTALQGLQTLSFGVAIGTDGTVKKQ